MGKILIGMLENVLSSTSSAIETVSDACVANISLADFGMSLGIQNSGYKYKVFLCG